MRKLIKLLVLIVLTISYSVTITAKQYMGKITIKVGEEYYVEAVPKTPAYSANGSWRRSNSHFVLAAAGRNSCTIRGNTVGSGTLSYSGLIDATGWWQVEHYDLYWDVEVQANSKPDSDPDPDPGPGSNPDIPDEPSEKWSDSGNYSNGWYKKDLDEFTLSTNKELAGMAYLINNGYTDFKDKTIKLSADIDLSGKKWVQCKTFKGTFDGQGHIVYGVYMGNDVSEQTQFGFWQYLDKATISNLIIQGVVNCNFNYDIDKERDTRTYVGGLAGYTSGSNIQHCSVNMDLFYTVGRMYTHYTNPKNAFVNVGGICGSGDRITNCAFTGNISVSCTVKGDCAPNGVDIAGICPYATIKNCESLIHKISLDDDATMGEMRISGIGSVSPFCCRSIIDLIDINGTAPYSKYSVDKNNYYVSGITAHDKSYNPINCYSSISKATLKVKNTKSNFYFGGICSSATAKATASFSNSDIDVDCNGTMIRGFDGDTGFTSKQMKASSFLEELNLYSTFEMDGPIWKQDEGGYPYINDFKYNGSVSHDDKCATPTISYLNGKLTFECETEGVEFKSYITDTDIREYTSSTIDLSAAYHISVYAAKEGYEDSDVATATLCWIDMEPYADGTKEAEDAVTEVKAMPILIQTNGNNITIRGVAEGMKIDVYGLDGVKHGSAVSGKDRTKIPTNLLPGSTAIVKFGDKAVKVMVK